MNDRLKKFAKHLLYKAGIDITQNQRYDRQTMAIMKKVLKPDSNAIDVGCHEGEMLDEMLQLAPSGQHWGFEPLPDFYQNLKTHFSEHKNIHLHQTALSSENGQAEFIHVKNAPAYSGLQERDYKVANPELEPIQVEKRKLDDIIPPETPINFIKIDVEGGEFDVMKGAQRLLTRWKPIVVFEYGMGAADHYHVLPRELYSFLGEKCGLRVSLMMRWLDGKAALTADEFEKIYSDKSEYYFIAYPLKSK